MVLLWLIFDGPEICRVPFVVKCPFYQSAILNSDRTLIVQGRQFVRFTSVEV